MTGTASELRYVPLAPGRADVVAVLSLDRPQMANALSEAMIDEVTAHLQAVSRHKDCRALVLRGNGKHFSAGADLGWMQAAAKLDYAGNLRDSERLIALFEALANVPMPSLALVHGSAFGGAVGLAAACDVVVALNTAKFCLSEVKLGLLPAVILPYLARKVQPGSLRSWALSGRLIDAETALRAGLVQRVVTDGDFATALREELNALLAGAPSAQASLKTLLSEVAQNGAKQGPYTAAAIASARVSASGQAGLAAFFHKASPPWALSLGPDWTLGLTGPSELKSSSSTSSAGG